MTRKQKCVKCKKTNQLVKCDGCQELWCNEHIAEHRETLSRQMNDIDKDYRDFVEQLNDNNALQTHVSYINKWERDSIHKIQRTAETARNDLLNLFTRMKTQIQSTCNEITFNIQAKQHAKEYSEINIEKWTEQLEKLRNIYKISSSDDIIDDKQSSSIRLIKVVDGNHSFSSDELDSYPPEKFDKVRGNITLSDDHHIATCSGRKWNGTDLSGRNLYSSGIHSIRFRVKINGKNNPFFGITSAARALNPYNHKTPYAYGWWNFPFDTNTQKDIKGSSIQTDDELTLTLDCFNNQIQFENHRTKQIVYETIENDQCPFPWKIAVVLYSPGDSVSILSHEVKS